MRPRIPMTTAKAALAAALACAALPAPGDAAGADIFERNRRLSRGVNFGNALEAPTEGAWGLTLKEDWFRLVAEAGFRSVRIPVKWSGHAAAAAPYAIETAFFARIDWAVAAALKHGLAPIVNVHHYDEMASDPAAHKDRWLGLWKQIAGRYRDQGPDVFFEILNEPNSALTAALWNQYLLEALAVIRASNPDRAVVIGPVDWNNVNRLKDLVLPEADRNLIATFHYYLPFPFTHQGAEWVEGSDAWLGTTWGGADEAAVLKDFEMARAWGEARGRPILVGEFGAYSKAEQASRVRWTTFVARTAEKAGFSWAYWEFGAGFGIYDPAGNRWRDDLKNALVGTPLAVRPAARPGGSLRIPLDAAGHPLPGVLLRRNRGWTDARGRRLGI